MQSIRLDPLGLNYFKIESPIEGNGALDDTVVVFFGDSRAAQ